VSFVLILIWFFRFEQSLKRKLDQMDNTTVVESSEKMAKLTPEEPATATAASN